MAREGLARLYVGGILTYAQDDSLYAVAYVCQLLELGRSSQPAAVGEPHPADRYAAPGHAESTLGYPIRNFGFHIFFVQPRAIVLTSAYILADLLPVQTFTQASERRFSNGCKAGVSSARFWRVLICPIM